MLQRIQSLYLLATVIIQILISQFSLLSFTRNELDCKLTVMGVLDSSGKVLVSDHKQVIILVLNCIFALLAIFIYKNRALQIKLTKLITYICVAQLTFVAVSFYQILNGESRNLSIDFSSFLIPICITLAVLAGKAIKKDEDLIKSVDRIR